jgi:hypothetical protein
MQISSGLKIIDAGWIQKPKGFRVKYQKLVDGQIVTEYSPPEGSALLDSDVTAWRYAWKLLVATQSNGDDIQPDELVNIHVVTDTGEKVAYYATGAFTVFNAKKAEG